MLDNSKRVVSLLIINTSVAGVLKLSTSSIPFISKVSEYFCVIFDSLHLGFNILGDKSGFAENLRNPGRKSRKRRRSPQPLRINTLNRDNTHDRAVTKLYLIYLENKQIHK